MTFLSSTFLLALIAASAPVLIHLLYRRRKQTIPWAAMQFLTAAAQKRKFYRLRDWLLMTLRTLTLICFILAMARPVINHTPTVNLLNRASTFLPAANNSAPADVILVLDTSISTSRSINNQQTLLNEIARHALDIASQLNPHDLLRVLETATPTTTRWVWPATRQLDNVAIITLRSDLQSLTPSRTCANIPAAIETAINASTTDDQRKRVIITITDTTAPSWQTDNPAAWQSLQNTIDNQSNPPAILILPINHPAAPTKNLAITSLTSDRPVAIPDHPLNLSAVITNPCATASKPTTARWSINNTQVGLSTIEPIKSYQSTTINITLNPPPVAASNQLHITCQLDYPDAVSLDNQTDLILPHIPTVNILAVEQSLDRLRSKYFQAAATQLNSPFKFTTVTTNQFPKTDLTDYHVILICDDMNWPRQSLDILQSATSRGSGLLLINHTATQPAIFNQSFHQPPYNFSRLPLSLYINSQPQSLDITNHPHPAIDLLQSLDSLDLPQVTVHQHHQLIASNPAATPLLQLADNTLLAAASSTPHSRTITTALSFDLTDSDLPLFQSYVVLTNEWLWWLAEKSFPQYNVTPTQTATFHSQTPVEIINSRKQSFAASPTTHNRINFHNTHYPGLYTITTPSTPDSPIRSLFVQSLPDHANLTPITKQQLQLLTRSTKIKLLSPVKPDLAKHLTPTRTLWQELFILALVLMTAELLLAAHLTKRTQRPIPPP